MALRAKLLVQLALQKIENDINNTFVTDKGISEPNENMARGHTEEKDLEICEQTDSQTNIKSTKEKPKEGECASKDQIDNEKEIRQKTDHLKCNETITSEESDEFNNINDENTDCVEKGNYKQVPTEETDSNKPEEITYSDPQEDRNDKYGTNVTNSPESETEDSVLNAFDDNVKDRDWIPDTRKRKHSNTDSSSDDDVGKSNYKSVKVVRRKDIVNEQSMNTNKTNLSHDKEKGANGKENASSVVEQEPVVGMENNRGDDAVYHDEIVSNTVLGENDERNPLNRQRAKKGKSDPKTWSRNSNKFLRMEGKAYKGVGKDSESGKVSNCVGRPERIQDMPNCGKRCDKIRKCNQISSATRKEIFDAFWANMNWDQKMLYVSSLVERCYSVESKVGSSSRRSFSYRYYLRDGEKRLKVCKNTFLATLGIGEKTVYNWISKSNDNGMPSSLNVDSIENGKKRVAESHHGAKKYSEELPKMESHYCRQSSEKKYIEPIFVTFSDLFRAYRGWCDEKAIDSVSRVTLLNIFNDLNLSLFKPKKDQCDICVSHETGNISIEGYLDHIKRKDMARNEKVKDKELTINNAKVKVFTMDAQGVLLCPAIEASAVYFKTKLACHNFTTYNLASKEVICYFWHEGEGGLASNNFASCIVNQIESAVNSNTEEVIIFSDGCCYQNRNVTLSNALVHTAMKTGVVITQKYLERGHTQMEVDSVHSTIERKLRKIPIYSPTNYVERISQARPNQPYKVLYLSHEFFKDYSGLKYNETIRPGRRVGDPVVTNIKVLRYLPNGSILYKLGFDEDFQELPKPRNSKQLFDDDHIRPLHQQPLKIKSTKYDHLQQLKACIPRDYHPFYDQLLHV